MLIKRLVEFNYSLSRLHQSYFRIIDEKESAECKYLWSKAEKSNVFSIITFVTSKRCTTLLSCFSVGI